MQIINNNILTPHFDITKIGSYLEFWLEDKYYLYEFNNNHKIIQRDIWIL